MVTTESDPARLKGPPSLVANEQMKLTATYPNVMAGSFFTAGVVAPIAAAVFGIAGSSGPIGALTLVLGTTIFMACSVALRIAARAVPMGLKP